LGAFLSGSPALWPVFSGAHLLAVLFTCNLKHSSTIANGRQSWLKNTGGRIPDYCQADGVLLNAGWKMYNIHCAFTWDTLVGIEYAMAFEGMIHH
jgi:hypothetical protein